MINSTENKIKMSNSKAGLSMVELLISMAIFGVIIGGLSTMLASNGRLTKGQTNAATANMAARKSLLRITDMVAQAHYIYPANQNISLGANINIETGRSALAFLLPSGTTYCPGSNQTYCGFVISVENRELFEDILGNSEQSSNFVLAGWRVENLVWPKDGIPSQSLVAWNNATSELLAGSVDKSMTDLASAEKLDSAKSNAMYDKEKLFSISELHRDQADGLIASVSPSITFVYGSSTTDKKISRSTHIFARAIPRGTPPNPN